jgi:riboflavin kinase/FMN adenylyltransferase
MYVARHHIHWHEIEQSVVTIGTFDGVHLGHRAIISTVLECAKTEQLYPLVVSFHPHPRKVLWNGLAVEMIDSLGERLHHFAELGVQVVCMLPFNRELVNLTPEQFVRDVLQGEFRAKRVVMGHDHAFGKNRGGDHDTLSRLGKAAGFEVIVVPPVAVNGEVVSSTAIRTKLGSGDVAGAAAMLGRYYAISGIAVQGASSVTGYPSARLTRRRTDKAAVRSGLYAGFVQFEQLRSPAAILVGAQPTGQGSAPSIDVELPDGQADLVGRKLHAHFVQRIASLAEIDKAVPVAEQIREPLAKVRAQLNL